MIRRGCGTQATHGVDDLSQNGFGGVVVVVVVVVCGGCRADVWQYTHVCPCAHAKCN